MQGKLDSGQTAAALGRWAKHPFAGQMMDGLLNSGTTDYQKPGLPAAACTLNHKRW